MEYQQENFNGAYDFRSNAHRAWQVGDHLHEYSELLYCKEGEGTVAAGGRAFLLRAGEYVYLPPNTVHRYDFPAATVICAVFSNDLIPLFFRALGEERLRPSSLPAKEVEGWLSRLPELRKEDACALSGILNLICAHVLRLSSREEGETADGILYQKVVTYLSRHYTEPISLSHLAAAFGYNEKYLSHALHSATGLHFKQLLRFYRVNRAKRLLEQSPALDVTRIAAESGFSAINTFNRAFREMTGMTPTAYRRHAK